MLAGAGSDPAGQGPSRGLPSIPLHDHPQGPGRRRLGRARAPDQDRSRLQDDRRCHRARDDGPGRCGGRDRAPGAGDQGVPQGSLGDSSRAPSRKTRYRKPRFDNSTRREGWLPPSLESRLANVLTWVARLCRLCPITAVSQELVRFDLQKEQNPEIAGIEYQQGSLAGYETKEYLLEKYDRTCAVLRQDGRAAPDRAHRPAEQGRDRPCLEPHPGVREVQPTQGEPAGRGLPEAGSGSAGEGPPRRQEAAQGRHGGQRDSMGAVPTAPGHRPAGGDGLGRSDQVQPHDPRGGSVGVAGAGGSRRPGRDGCPGRDPAPGSSSPARPSIT